MSELENADVIDDHINDAGQVESSTADSAPAKVEETTTEVSELDQLRAEKAEAQKATAEKAFKEREARRRADELEKRLAELEEKSKPSFDGKIPELPDPFDDDYSERMKEYRTAIERKAQSDIMANQQRERDAETQRKREREQYEQQQELISTYEKHVNDLGLDVKEMAKAEQVLVDKGVTQEVGQFILSDKNGPLMAKYLAANPMELLDIIEASPIRQGILLADVKSKSLSLKPKPSSAPPPAETLEGRASPQKKRGAKGTVFK